MSKHGFKQTGLKTGPGEMGWFGDGPRSRSHSKTINKLPLTAAPENTDRVGPIIERFRVSSWSFISGYRTTSYQLKQYRSEGVCHVILAAVLSILKPRPERSRVKSGKLPNQLINAN